MYRIAICEDEPLMAQENEATLCRVLEAGHFQRDIDFSVSSFSAAEPLLTALRNQPSAFHLLLLDIRLARENGVELANRLREWNVDCSIIYITSYDEYMSGSFATHPLEYLMKPVDEERLEKAIQWDLQKNYRPDSLRCPSKAAHAEWRQKTSSMRRRSTTSPPSICRGKKSPST